MLPLLLLATGCEEIASDDPIETHDDTFQVSGETVVDVDSFNGSVTVTSTEDRSVRVQATLKRADRMEYSVTQFGSDIQVEARETSSSFANSPSVEIEITAPANAQLVIRTSNGSIRIDSFEAGAVLRTSNGRITVNGLSGTLEANSSNGNIEVTDFTGSATLVTSNGSIRLTGELVTGSENDISTSNGSITIDLDDDASVVFEGVTSNGSVSSDLPIQVSSSGESHLEGIVGDGTATLDARTSNGSITLR